MAYTIPLLYPEKNANIKFESAIYINFGKRDKIMKKLVGKRDILLYSSVEDISYAI